VNSGQDGDMPKAPITQPCEPRDVAEWIGLSDATLLGTEPILLSPETVERLKLYGARVELPAADAAAVVRIGYKSLLAYTQAERRAEKKPAGKGRPRMIPREIVLGRRKAGGRVFVGAADLAVFIMATRSPPTRTTGAIPRFDAAAARRLAEETQRRFNLPRDSR
jgi:hypothetical protein